MSSMDYCFKKVVKGEGYKVNIEKEKVVRDETLTFA